MPPSSSGAVAPELAQQVDNGTGDAMANRVEFGGVGHRYSVGERGLAARRVAQVDGVDGLLASFQPSEASFAQRHVLSCVGHDNAPRWNPGERLHHLFERRCDRFGDRAAVVTDAGAVTYRELDERANQVARHLIGQGIGAGDRVALLFDKSVDTYVALLAVLKVNAAYVPLDAGFPVERVRFILGDAGVKAIVSMSDFTTRLAAFDVGRVFLDVAAQEIAARPRTRLAAGEVAAPADQVCYVIYTSGTTGNPKGVVVEHPSICNFVQVAAELYGYAPGDRVYQGMTIAFDFSVEEVWVPLMAGATLVPGKPGASLVGEELADFLDERAVTCLACCPTLLATIERDLPALRILLVGGEACPQNLVVRWHRPGRAILNSYGPTEATVTATLTELVPDKPVTIGRPLPTYSIVILDPVTDQVVPHGELGEIGIAGIGVAAGYLNRDDLTRQKFIADFLAIPHNPSGRIYRTGDLGRVTADGEIEYRGRIDTQVKIRGYRIELIEIESVLMELPQIAQAAVATHEPEPGQVELVAYYALKQGMGELSRGDIAQALRGRLPAYMVPAYIEELPFIPMSISNKADHKRLPKPKGERFRAGGAVVAARTDTERTLAAALAEVLKVDAVSVEAHFFDDLGANSLVMARFCARIRRTSAMGQVSMRDIYVNPTLAKLATHLDRAGGDDVAVARSEPLHVPSDFAYWGCGALQLAFFAAYGLFVSWLFATGFAWTYEAVDDPLALYGRTVAFAALSLAVLTALPIAAKWLLVGRFGEQTFPIWSLRYFRFWVVKSLVRTAPPAALPGSPIYNLYLRLLGARIGRGAVLMPRFVPVATDLIAIGDGAVLSKETIVLGYRAQSNHIQLGPVSIGRGAFVGEASVLDIDTAIGDGGQLGHASSLQSGQRVPDGGRYHGSPAIETATDYSPVEARQCGTLRRGLYGAFQLAGIVAVVVPLPLAVFDYWHAHGAAGPALGFLASALVASAAMFFGPIVVGLAVIYGVPRIANAFLEPGRTYPLYGVHYGLQQLVWRASNSQFFNVLFGDSSFVVRHMRWLGWNLNTVDQTGSNFGTNQRHDNPFLCDVGSGTMVSDGVSMMNMHMSSTSFRLATTRIGERNYLGNDIHFPPDGRTGANCLLGTKVMIPVDGPVRENVGLLGSPPFEIPRMVERDKSVNAAFDGATRLERLGRKNRHNFVTACLFLATRWAFVFAAIVVTELALAYQDRFGVLAPFAAGALVTAMAVGYFALVERASLGFRRLTAQQVSIYDPYFWAHERHWKLSDTPIMQLFAGTPFKSLVLWAVGVDVGHKVYDAGCSITDRSLTRIGDHANLNEGSVLQAHSLEEGVFKSDVIAIGAGSTLGPGAFVHYGVTMGDNVVLAADSFLMKGETLDAGTVWRGNPARMVGANPVRGAGPVADRVAKRRQAAPREEAPQLLAACVAAE